MNAESNGQCKRGVEVCIAGKGRLAIETAKFICSLGTKERLVALPAISDPGYDTWQPSFSRFCRRVGIPIVTEEYCQQMSLLLFLSLQYDCIIKPSRFRSDLLFNLHFSLLPEYKGVLPTVWPFLERKSKSGVTLHYIDGGIDTGDIVAQAEIAICDRDDSRSLFMKCQDEGIRLMQQWYGRLLSGDLVASQQSHINSSYFSVDKARSRSADLDLNQTAEAVVQQLKSLCFSEFQLPIAHGYAIESGFITPQRSHKKPGRVVAEDVDRLVVSTIDFDVVLRKDLLTCFINSCEAATWDQAGWFARQIEDHSVRNAKGWNALIVALYHGRLELVEVILANGADPNITNFKGTTALMFACSGARRVGDDSCVRALLSAGADCSVLDRNEKSVIDYVRDSGDIELLSLIAGRSS